MTLVLFSKNHREIAADSNMLRYGTRLKCNKLSIHEHQIDNKPCTIAIGLSGKISDIQRLQKWILEDNCLTSAFPIEKSEDLSLLVVTHWHKTDEFQINYYEGGPYPTPILDDCFAIGSGNEAGMTGVALGHEPAEVIRAVAKVTVLVDDRVISHYFPDHRNTTIKEQ